MRRAGLLLMAAAAALSPAGFANAPDGASAAPAAGTIMIKDFAFSPATLTAP